MSHSHLRFNVIRCSWWFHYIISLDISIQCNLRSGLSGRSRDAIDTCGFQQYKS